MIATPSSDMKRRKIDTSETAMSLKQPPSSSSYNAVCSDEIRAVSDDRRMSNDSTATNDSVIDNFTNEPLPPSSTFHGNYVESSTRPTTTPCHSDYSSRAFLEEGEGESSGVAGPEENCDQDDHNAQARLLHELFSIQDKACFVRLHGQGLDGYAVNGPFMQGIAARARRQQQEIERMREENRLLRERL